MAGEPADVALLMTASGSLDIFLTRFNIVTNETFCVIFLQSDQQHHAAPEVALTVRSMLLTRKFRH